MAAHFFLKTGFQWFEQFFTPAWLQREAFVSGLFWG